MRGRPHQRQIVGRDLARLGDLKRLRAVGVPDPERAAARLTLVADHAADADRTVQHGAQQRRIVIGGEFHAEPLLDKSGDRLQLRTAHFEGLEALESAFLQVEQNPRQHLFITDRIPAAGIGRHVVDILDEDDVGVDFVQVLDQRPVARGTEQQRAVGLPERRVVGIHGKGVGRRLLHRERDVVTDAEPPFVKGNLLREQLLEARDVLGRDGEMDARDTSRRGVGRTFDQVFLDGLARPFGIGVEGDQPLGLAAVVQPVVDDGIHDGTVVGPGGQHGAKLGPEGELPDIFQQRVDALAAFAVVDELEQFLEHARGGSRSGHELHHTQSGRLFFIAFHGGIGLRLADNQHAVARRCGPHDIQERESAAEILQLGLRQFGCQAMIGNLFQIFLCKHRFRLFCFQFAIGRTATVATAVTDKQSVTPNCNSRNGTCLCAATPPEGGGGAGL